MSDSLREPQSYFEYQHTSGSHRSSSPPTSPTASARVARKPSRSARFSPPARPTHHRTRSDFTAASSRWKSPPIQEDSGAQNRIFPRRVVKNHEIAPPATQVKPSITVKQHSSHSTRSAVATTPPPPPERFQQPKTTTVGERTSPPSRPKIGHLWSRTRSAGLWFQRPLSRTSAEHIDDTPIVVSEVVTQRNFLTPLPPPKRLHDSISGHAFTHSVKVEKSFTQLSDVPPPAPQVDSSQPRAERQDSRRSSFNPKKLFSIPLITLRKANQPRSTPFISESQWPTPLDEPQMPSHNSQLKKTYTPDVLQKVNSRLQEIRSTKEATKPGQNVLKSPTWRPASNVLNSADDLQPRDNLLMRRGILSTPTLDTRKSQDYFSLPISQTSSLLELSMGRVPGNSPREHATYKIKRSPSADTEEFFKVDISIRGGTSYLPSEARRIHTPPLPGEGSDGKKRGFFFDYSGPHDDNQSVYSEKHGEQPKAGARFRRAMEDVKDKAKNLRPPTIGHHFGRRMTTRVKTGDWFDVQLAEIDAPTKALESPRPGCSRAPSLPFSQYQESEPEEKIDYDIPEHLPSSPLCPRHPTYWMVVKGKGSQYRGCWMHGVGEYENGEWNLNRRPRLRDLNRYSGRST